MSDPFNKIPEPALPEHQLLREIADLPQLSTGLRQRVIVDVHRQVRYGRWADRLRVPRQPPAGWIWLQGGGQTSLQGF